MLVHLSIRGFAIIDALELSLEPGLTVLTGETGAGKSIVVDALELLLGGRARTDVIRAGEEEAELACQFALAGDAARRLDRVLKEQGLAGCDDGALVLRRILSRSGRHRQFINGTLATVSQLKQVAAPLVDFTGQHAQQALVRPLAQLDVLDAYGDLGGLRREVAEAWEAARATSVELEELRSAEAGKVERIEWLRYQVEEIAALAPEVGEEERLVAEHGRLMNVEKLREYVGRALGLLTDDENGDALSRVQQASTDLGRFADDDTEIAGLQQSLEEAAALIDDVARTLTRTVDGLEEDPERLQVVDDRLDALRRLMRKHGGSVEAVLDAAERMQKELDTLEHAEIHIGALEKRFADELAALQERCQALTKKRKAAAKKLGRAVQSELGDLGMGGARLEVCVDPIPATADSALTVGHGDGRRALSRTGADRVELLLAANVGESAGPLAKAASGGELSRILLGLKRVLLAKDPAPLSIFDEVDTGVGGAIGEVIGKKLREVGQGRQVLCVTHLPQIAALGDHHLRVEKAVVALGEESRTVSRVVALDADARVDEVSRMLGGQVITDRTRAHARELLQTAG